MRTIAIIMLLTCRVQAGSVATLSNQGTSKLLSKRQMAEDFAENLVGKVQAAVLATLKIPMARKGCTTTAALTTRMARGLPIVCHASPSPQNPDAQGAVLANKFDVVVFSSSTARLLFRRIIGSFQCPDEGANVWPEKVRRVWDGFIEATQKDRKVMQLRTVFPMVALNGEVPCAAAFYSDATTNDKGTYYLSGLIRNVGDTCKGGGAAILCHLIQNSNIGNPFSFQFSPLKLNVPNNEPTVKKYYESFGCSTIEKNKVKWNFWEEEQEEMSCTDPNPPKCKQYVDEVFDADDYFGDNMQTLWQLR